MTLEEFNKLFESRRNPVIVNRYSIPIFSIFGFIFIVMKLTGHITWSWWWVLAPFWIPTCIAIIILLLLCVLVVLESKKNNYNANVVVENPQKDTSIEEEPKKTVEKKTSKKKTKNGGTSEKNGQMPKGA